MRSNFALNSILFSTRQKRNVFYYIINIYIYQFVNFKDLIQTAILNLFSLRTQEYQFKYNFFELSTDRLVYAIIIIAKLF